MSEQEDKPKLTNKLLAVVNKIKNFTIAITAFTVTIGILALFISSLFLDKASINDMNSFVGIVLGIVATCCSILSIYLSFYSLEKSEESGQEQLQLIKEILHQQDNLKQAIQYKPSESREITQSSSNDWQDIKGERKDS